MGALIPKMIPVAQGGIVRKPHGVVGDMIDLPETVVPIDATSLHGPKFIIKADVSEFERQIQAIGRLRALDRRQHLHSRCSYCHTLHTAAVRCESCGAPR